MSGSEPEQRRTERAAGIAASLHGPLRRWFALALLAAIAGLAWTTMDAGKIRWAVMILLGAFALRIALSGSRYHGVGSK